MFDDEGGEFLGVNLRSIFLPPSLPPLHTMSSNEWFTSSSSKKLSGHSSQYTNDGTAPANTKSPAIACGVVMVENNDDPTVTMRHGSGGIRKLSVSSSVSDNPVTNNDKRHIGSDGKAMTAMLAAILVDKDIIAFSSTVEDICDNSFPNMKECYKEITLLSLLSHTGSIPPGAGSDEVWSLAWKLNTNFRTTENREVCLDKLLTTVEPCGTPNQ